MWKLLSNLCGRGTNGVVSIKTPGDNHLFFGFSILETVYVLLCHLSKNIYFWRHLFCLCIKTRYGLWYVKASQCSCMVRSVLNIRAATKDSQCSRLICQFVFDHLISQQFFQKLWSSLPWGKPPVLGSSTSPAQFCPLVNITLLTQETNEFENNHMCIFINIQ